MDLIYTSPEHTTIQATLYEGEHLGNHAGPAVIFVPTDPANVEYQAIQTAGYTIAPCRPPTANTPTSAPEVDPVVKAYVDRTVAELAMTLRTRLEDLDRRIGR